MNGKQFIKNVRRWAKLNNVQIDVEASRGKGGHQILRLGKKWTTVQTGELKPGVFYAMLKQLGLSKEDF